jgi:hypothetical protein
LNQPPKSKRESLTNGRRELKEIVETCEAISERKFNPFFLDVKLGVETLRQYFPFWQNFPDHCLDAHALNRLSEVVRLQNTQLKFQSSALYADPEFIIKKVERMSEKRLAEVFLQSWHPLTELEQLTEETISNAADYWNTLTPIAERWKRRTHLEGTRPTSASNETLTELGIHGEEFNQQILKILNELRTTYNSSQPVDYWTFVRRSDYQETVHRAYLVSFLVTYDYAKLRVEENRLSLIPNDQPSGKTKQGALSYPIPIPKSQ